MQHIKDVLLKAYERKEQAQEVLTELQQALQNIKNTVPEHLKNAVSNARVQSYEKGILMLSLPRRSMSPDIYFIIHDLKDALKTETGKNIRQIKLVVKNPS